MSAILIAIAIMLGIITSPSDVDNLTETQRTEMQNIVIEDHQQM